MGEVIERLQTYCDTLNFDALLRFHHRMVTYPKTSFSCLWRLEHWLDDLRVYHPVAQASYSLRLFLHYLVVVTRMERDLKRTRTTSTKLQLMKYYAEPRVIMPPAGIHRAPVRIRDIHRVRAHMMARVYYDRWFWRYGTIISLPNELYDTICVNAHHPPLVMTKSYPEFANADVGKLTYDHTSLARALVRMTCMRALNDRVDITDSPCQMFVETANSLDDTISPRLCQLAYDLVISN